MPGIDAVLEIKALAFEVIFALGRIVLSLDLLFAVQPYDDAKPAFAIERDIDL